MKKIYLQPSMEMSSLGTESIICASQDITSDYGIGYGGVDEDGGKDPASRRSDVWMEEKTENEEF